AGDGVGGGREGTAPGGNDQQVDATGVPDQITGDQPRCRRSPPGGILRDARSGAGQHHRTRRVAEQHGGGASGGIGETGQRARAHHERRARHALADQRRRGGEAVDEAGAGGVQVEGAGGHSQVGGPDRGGGRGRAFGGAGRAHH